MFFLQLLSRCFESKEKRPSAKELLTHPFLKYVIRGRLIGKISFSFKFLKEFSVVICIEMYEVEINLKKEDKLFRIVPNPVWTEKNQDVEPEKYLG